MVQVLAASFYLLNKIFFALAERNFGTAQEQFWRKWAWVVYLIGLIPWLVIFAKEDNWIAFFVEAGGVPSMILGLVIALRGKGQEPAWLNWVALMAAVVGCYVSYNDLGGFGNFTQYLEFGLAVGFLGGTFLLAKQHAFGYVFFMLMNGCNAYLQYEQGYPLLVAQQVFSFCVMVYAYNLTLRRQRKGLL